MKKSNEVVSIKIGGQAGQGVKSVGLMLAKLASRSGYHIYDHIEFPSLIRGGHNVMQINFSVDEVLAPRRTNDLLVALNQETITKHLNEMPEGSGIMYDSESSVDTKPIDKKINLYPIPLSKLAKEAGGSDLYINIVTLGAIAGLYNGSIETLTALITAEFGKKGEEIVGHNITAAASGYSFVKSSFASHVKDLLKPIQAKPYMVVNGCESTALGAIAAGMQFSAIYPMSPISNILSVFAANQEKYNFIYKQPEDEISAINMSIGASHAGARSLTATSGGGFCLMAEGYGLAGMVEVPLVIIEGMRGGPATGLPTWSGQGDLQFILHAHQDEFPRIVLGASDAKEAFELTMKAFNLADKYQTPVVVIIDKNICENDQNYEIFDTSSYKIERGKFEVGQVADFKRYKIEADGVSTRSVPGSGNFFIANSDEHDELGYSTEEISERNAMMEKRMRKLENCVKEDMEAPQIFGKDMSMYDLTIVSWGSNKGSILEALKNFENVNYIHITWLNPFPTKEISNLLKSTKKLLLIECDYTGQLGQLIREKTGIEIKEKMLSYDGRQLYPEDIAQKIKDVLGGTK